MTTLIWRCARAVERSSATVIHSSSPFTLVSANSPPPPVLLDQMSSSRKHCHRLNGIYTSGFENLISMPYGHLLVTVAKYMHALAKGTCREHELDLESESKAPFVAQGFASG